jgi:hypothetical protein
MAKKTDSTSKPAAAAKRATKPAVKSKPAATKAKPKAKPAAKTTKPKAPAYTQEDVALRAYFIAEKRRTGGIPGDEHQDWVEAERQLAAESKRPKKTGKS